MEGFTVVSTAHPRCIDCLRQAENLTIRMKAFEGTYGISPTISGHHATVERNLN